MMHCFVTLLLCYTVVYHLVTPSSFRIMTVTAEMMSRMPSAMLRVNGSPKMAMPTQTAVTGSIAPNTDVSVEPMFLMARTSARLDITVGTNASITRLPNVVRSGMACNPIPEISVPVNNRIPPNKKT